MLRIWEMKFEKFERFSKKMGTLGPRLSHKFCSQTRQSSKRIQQTKKSFLFKCGDTVAKIQDVKIKIVKLGHKRSALAIA